MISEDDYFIVEKKQLSLYKSLTLAPSLYKYIYISKEEIQMNNNDVLN